MLPGNVALKGRLLSCVEDFLTARASSTLFDFESQWSQLGHDIVSSDEDGTLDMETRHLAHEVASSLETLCDKFRTLDLCNLAWSHQLVEQLPCIDSSSVSDEIQVSPALYVQQAYDWLLQNLHNPYPSNAIRDEICAATGSQRKFIDTWFIEARKRIGWNDLRKKEGWFRTRKEMVDAATRHFVQPDDRRPLLPQQELEFVMIEDRAARMYGEKLMPSQLVIKLADAVKDMTPELKAQAMETKRQERLKRRRVVSRATIDGATREGSEGADVSQCSSAHKRCASEEAEDDSPDEPSNKRSRVECSSSSTLSTSSSTVPSRKRRLSESESSSSMKRSRHDLASAGLRSVSDPSPAPPVILESFPDLDKWFSKIVGTELATEPLESVLGLQEGGGSLALDGGLWANPVMEQGDGPAPASTVREWSLDVSQADLFTFNTETLELTTPELCPSSSLSDEESDSLFGSEEGDSTPVTPNSQPLALATFADKAAISPVEAQLDSASVSIANIDESFDFTTFNPSSFGLPSIDIPALDSNLTTNADFAAMLGNLASWPSVNNTAEISDSAGHVLDSYAQPAWQFPQQVQQGTEPVTPQSIMSGVYATDGSVLPSGGLFDCTAPGGQHSSQQNLILGALQWQATAGKHLSMVMPHLGLNQFVY